jgi:hypothetical protein
MFGNNIKISSPLFGEVVTVPLQTFLIGYMSLSLEQAEIEASKFQHRSTHTILGEGYLHTLKRDFRR